MQKPAPNRLEINGGCLLAPVAAFWRRWLPWAPGGGGGLCIAESCIESCIAGSCIESCIAVSCIAGQGQVRCLRRFFSTPRGNQVRDRSGACGAFFPRLAAIRSQGRSCQAVQGPHSCVQTADELPGDYKKSPPNPPLLGTDDLTRPATRELSARVSAVRPSSAGRGKSHGSFPRCPRPADRRLRTR